MPNIRIFPYKMMTNEQRAAIIEEVRTPLLPVLAAESRIFVFTGRLWHTCDGGVRRIKTARILELVSTCVTVEFCGLSGTRQVPAPTWIARGIMEQFPWNLRPPPPEVAAVLKRAFSTKFQQQ